MKAGQTNINVGSKVGIVKSGDSNLTGKVTHPFGFGCTDKGWIGIYLDQGNVYTGDTMNIHESQIKIIE